MFGSLNINKWFANHIDQLSLLIEDYKFDVLAINETKLDPTIPDGLVKINGYKEMTVILMEAVVYYVYS